MYEMFPGDGIERSYGIIPLREDNKNGLEVLFIQHLSTGEYGFPKGHAEPHDANPLAAARRELLEETGLSASGFVFDPTTTCFDSTYTNPRTGKQKIVLVWAATVAPDARVVIQPEEIMSYKWVKLGDAHTVASWKEDRDILEKLIKLVETVTLQSGTGAFAVDEAI